MILSSFIVPCFNSQETVKICINSILHQNNINENVEIIIIDDGSTDNTLDIISKYDDRKNIKIISYAQNKGLAYARNMGITNASGDILVFLDSDMELNADWLENVYTILNDNAVMGVMGQYCLPRDTTPNVLDKYLYSSMRGAKKYHKTADAIHFKYFLFSNTAIKREALNQAGNFNEKFEKYGGEDTELSIRLYQHYSRGLFYYDHLVAFHHGQKSLKEFCENMKEYGKNNLPRLVRMYPEHKNSLGGYWLDSFGGLLLFNRFVWFVVRGVLKIFPSIMCIRYQIIYNTIAGFRSRNL